MIKRKGKRPSSPVSVGSEKKKCHHNNNQAVDSNSSITNSTGTLLLFTL